LQSHPGAAVSWNFTGGYVPVQNLPLTETKSLQFRVEAFNFLNKPQFGTPSNLSWNTSNPGTPGAPVSGFGAITSTVPFTFRQIQLR